MAHKAELMKKEVGCKLFAWKLIQTRVTVIHANNMTTKH